MPDRFAAAGAVTLRGGVRAARRGDAAQCAEGPRGLAGVGVEGRIVKRGKVYYAKLARSKTMFLAPRMIPYFHAVWGVRRSEEKQRLSERAKILRCCAGNGR